MTLADGTALSPALGIGAFAEKTLVAAGQATKVDPAARPEAAGLLGCGVMAGFGAAVNTGGVQRGDTVAVFGCGGVGDAAIAGAALGRRAHDHRRRPRRRGSSSGRRSFGATHTVDASKDRPGRGASRRSPTATAPTSASRRSADPRCCSRRSTPATSRAPSCRSACPTPDMALPDIPMIDFFGRGGALKPSWYGDCLPSRDFPLLIDLYLQGRFDLDRFVSETIALDEVEDAFHKMERGEVLRSVVVL